jgi:hypothetical protein
MVCGLHILRVLRAFGEGLRVGGVCAAAMLWSALSDAGDVVGLGSCKRAKFEGTLPVRSSSRSLRNPPL